MNGYVYAELFEANSSVDAQPALDPTVIRRDEAVCRIRGAASLDVQCKIICKNCGFMRDCGDP
jgi:hypothetical protein